jgi:ribose 1,5-bisphosphokinase PhnN
MERWPIETERNKGRENEEEIKRNKIRNKRKQLNCEMHYVLSWNNSITGEQQDFLSR